MNLSRNRQLRKMWFARLFVLNPRTIVLRRAKILQSLRRAAERNNVLPRGLIRTRCKRIAKFVMIERRTGWINDAIDALMALSLFLFQIVLIPLIVFLHYDEFIVSGWRYVGGIALMVLILPFILILPRFVFCKIFRLEFQPFAKLSSHFLANASFVLLLCKWYFHLQFPYWIIGGMMIYAFFNVMAWIISPLVEFIKNRIIKRIAKTHPLEKSTYLMAQISNGFSRAGRKGRMGSLAWRIKACSTLDQLILIAEKYAGNIIKVKDSSTKIAIVARCAEIAQNWKFQRTQILFPKETTAGTLSASFNNAFVALFSGNFGNLETITVPPPVHRGFRLFLRKVLPSIVLLAIWIVVYVSIGDRIGSNISIPLWVITCSLFGTAVLQYFDRDLHDRVSMLSKVPFVGKWLN